MINRRFLIAAAAIFAVASAAIAQDKPAPVAFQDPLQITISRAHLQAVGQGLMKLPYETAAPILADLQAQLNKADQAATEDAKKLEAEKAAAKEPAKDQEKPKTAPPKDAK